MEEALKQKLVKRLGGNAVLVYDEKRQEWVEAGLSYLIKRASDPKVRILNLELHRAANGIKDAGNDCVHGKLAKEQVESTAQKTLQDTRLIVSEICAEERGR